MGKKLKGDKKSARRANQLLHGKALQAAPREAGAYTEQSVARHAILDQIRSLTKEYVDFDRPERFEVVVEQDGDKVRYGIYDHRTRLRAWWGWNDSTYAEVQGDADILNKDPSSLPDYGWEHLFTNEVHLASHDARFALMEHPDGESYGVYFIEANQVLPLGDVRFDEAIDEVVAFEDGEADPDIHDEWVSVEEWAAPSPPDPGPQAAAATETVELEPVRFMVLSSRNWGYAGLMPQVVQQHWNRLGNPPLILMTTGMPFGAEAEAQLLAQNVEGVTHETLLPESWREAWRDMSITAAFVFATHPTGDGTDKLWNEMQQAGIPIHSFLERRPETSGAWSDR